MELHPGHMFSGQLSMSDVKLKISQITQYALFSEFTLKIRIPTKRNSLTGRCKTQRKGGR